MVNPLIRDEAPNGGERHQAAGAAQVVSIGEARTQQSEASRVEMEIHVQAPLLPAVLSPVGKHQEIAIDQCATFPHGEKVFLHGEKVRH
jgi:hypothetical protein